MLRNRASKGIGKVSCRIMELRRMYVVLLTKELGTKAYVKGEGVSKIIYRLTCKARAEPFLKCAACIHENY